MCQICPVQNNSRYASRRFLNFGDRIYWTLCSTASVTHWLILQINSTEDWRAGVWNRRRKAVPPRRHRPPRGDQSKTQKTKFHAIDDDTIDLAERRVNPVELDPDPWTPIPNRRPSTYLSLLEFIFRVRQIDLNFLNSLPDLIKRKVNHILFYVNAIFYIYAPYNFYNLITNIKTHTNTAILSFLIHKLGSSA